MKHATRRQADNVPASEVRALLASSPAARQQRLSAADMITVAEAAQLMRTTRQTIDDWIATGRAIGMAQTRRGARMPRWQFEPAIWHVLPRLSAALGTTEGWELLQFLETPHGGLDDVTSLHAIEQGRADQVLQLAEHEGL